MNIDWWAFLLFALLGSFGHCVGMCGAIVASYARVCGHYGHLYYSIGKTSAYMILGAAAGAMGSLFQLNPLSSSLLFVALGVMMIAFGLSMGLQTSFLIKFERSLIKFIPIQKCFVYARHIGARGILILGFSNGLLPCGLVYMALLSAAGSGSALLGMLLMALFGICTLLPLLLFGTFAQWLSTAWHGILMRCVGVFVIIFGCWFISVGINTFFQPTHQHPVMHQH